MAWRGAKSLDVILGQLNEGFPKRSKVSDGGIGDAKHATRDSDHNPYIHDAKGIGVYTARDFTHDPKTGIDCNWLAEQLQKHRDPRIKYVIWDGRIMSSTVSPWTWRKYTGINKHNHHLHLSVNKSNYDLSGKWKLDFPNNKTLALADVARVTDEGEPLKPFETPATTVPVAVCPNCDKAYDPIDNPRFADELCPDCGEIADAQASGKTDADNRTFDPSNPFDYLPEKPTKLKGWAAGLIGFLLTNLAAFAAWFTGLPSIVQAAALISGAIATSALVWGVIWIKNQREERAHSKELEIIRAKGTN